MLESDDARREIDRAARLMVAGELVASITHDLRQPLTAIEMNVAAALRLLEQARRPTRQSRSHGASCPTRSPRCATRSPSNIECVTHCKCCRISSAQREPSFKPLDLEASVREVVRLLASDPAARRVRIDVRCVDRRYRRSPPMRRSCGRRCSTCSSTHSSRRRRRRRRSRGPLVVELRVAARQTRSTVTVGARAAGESTHSPTAACRRRSLALAPLRRRRARRIAHRDARRRRPVRPFSPAGLIARGREQCHDPCEVEGTVHVG